MTYETTHCPESRSMMIRRWSKEEYSVFAKSFSRYEQKKLQYGALIGCFLIVLTLCTVFKPYLGPLPVLNLKLSMDKGLEMLMINEEISNSPQLYSHLENTKPVIRNFSNSRSDVYEMLGDIRIHGKHSSTIFVPSSHENNTSTITINPYARKLDQTAMRKVRTLQIVKQAMTGRMPHCSRNLSVPAIIFSTGGYAGNMFHDFSDVLIPLYLTSHQFNGKVVFLITNKYSWWISKYKVFLDKLSNFDVMDIDNENEVLCFSRIIVGLKANKEFGIDPLLSPPYSLADFTMYLRSTYSLKREFVNDFRNDPKTRRPRMLIISRKKSRLLINEKKVANMARRLGFDVIVKELVGWNVSLDAQFVNSFDVMIGVHGAGLTNIVFLPKNAVVIQIVPIGLESLAKSFFQLTAEDMNLRYFEYKVNLNESSLLGQYPLDSEVYRDPHAILVKGFLGFREVYLDKQDVNLDLGRFRKILLTTLELLRK